MIAIFDNGGTYSDREIWFVDIGDEDPKLIEKVARAGNWQRPTIIATAPSVAWHVSDRLTPLTNLVGGFWCDDEDDFSGVDSETIRALLRLSKHGATNAKLLNSILAARGDL